MNKIISRKLATDAIDGIMTQLYHIALSGSAENAADQINFVTILQELVQLRHNDDYKAALEQMSMEGFTEYYTLFFDLVNAMGLESVKDLSDWRVVNTKTLPQAISQTKKTGDVVELLQGFNATELSPLPYNDKIGTVKRILNDWFVLDDKERQIVKLLDSVSSPEERTVLSNALLEGNNSLLKTLLSKIDGEEKLTAFRFFDELLSSAKGPKETVTIPDGRTVGGIFKKDKIKLTSYYASSNIGGIKDKEYLVSPFATVMYTYKKERFPLPAFFFTDQNVLNDFIFENRYAETLDWATLTEKQKDDYYFEFVMHYLPQGFIEAIGSPLEIVIAGIIGIIAMGLFGEFTLFVKGLKIAGGVSISAGILFALKKAADTYKQRKNVTSMRELKNNAREFAVSIAQIGVQIINLVMLFTASRKGRTTADEPSPTTRSGGQNTRSILTDAGYTSEKVFANPDTASRIDKLRYTYSDDELKQLFAKGRDQKKGIGTILETLEGKSFQNKLIAQIGEKSYIQLSNNQVTTLRSFNENDTIFSLLKTMKDGKIEGKIPFDDYIAIRHKSVHNTASDTLTLGKYDSVVLPNGNRIPTSESYNVKAMEAKNMYFDLGTEWNDIKAKYKLTNDNMFNYFNIPALDDAVVSRKDIRFTHDPRLKKYELDAIFSEWNYLMKKHGYVDLLEDGGFWYAYK